MSEFGGCFSENNSFLNERCNKTKINGITTIGFAQLLLYFVSYKQSMIWRIDLQWDLLMEMSMVLAMS